MDFLWALVGLGCAMLINIDGKLAGPYLSFTQLVFGYPELVANYTARPLWQGLLRRAVYPLAGGLLLGFLSRDLNEAATAGLFATFPLIWPAFLHGLPPEYSRAQVIFVYVGLLAMSSGLAMTGWYIAEAFASPRDLAAFLLEHIIGIAVGLVLSAFGAVGTVGAVRSASADRP